MITATDTYLRDAVSPATLDGNTPSISTPWRLPGK